jgi:predicted nucleic acid-binding protein
VIVVDASVVVWGLLAESPARRLLMDEEIAVPHLVDSEVTHALRGQVARRAISEGDAGRALHRWSRLGVSRLAAVGHLTRFWELRENVTAYDATYVALAEALECHLVTADARLSRAVGPRCPITVLPGV